MTRTAGGIDRVEGAVQPRLGLSGDRVLLLSVAEKSVRHVSLQNGSRTRGIVMWVTIRSRAADGRTVSVPGQF
ncbi:hypothetical protein GCM10027169_08180 [Gordonia jinhuaensis]|uniref:Uncharacterized protein n=1 Tax=Gordonia jinhuaensis TaxID=1517702 RepID=A0A916THK0_9ACTN|nr:hypothetical protein GCM10011489_36520 [Gordonia jinhuaensis]